MQIFPLSEGAFTVDASKEFVPFDKLKDDLQKRPKGSLLVEIQPFAVVTSKDIIVIDTGLGFAKDQGVLQIHQNLKNVGIDPEKVTKVLLSHLHKDHSRGISSVNANQQRQLNFPNAKYYVNKVEFDFAKQKGKPSYPIDELDILSSSSQVEFLPGNGTIDGYITYEHTGAHCPWHQVFWIRENNETVFYGGDVAPQLIQMKNRFIAKYDFDGRKSMELRQQWWETGQRENWKFLFYHDIKTPVFS
jgi:glyoxylase-like metal-dependent hydrolase (beta-lactamase superfamily II)